VFGIGCVVAAISVSVIPACLREAREIEPVPVAEDLASTPAQPRAVQIDLHDAGTEVPIQPLETFEQPWPKRQFTFLVTGYGAEPRVGNAIERKTAALEAAVIDAIGRAVREMQRDPKTGRAPVEYKKDLSNGLTVFGQLVSGAPQTVVLLSHRGRAYELCARNGALMHPPHDSKIVQEIFAAAGGRLVLQATRATDRPGRYSADVGYYRQARADAGTRPATDKKNRSIIATGR
jgi:hypothetical protein